MSNKQYHSNYTLAAINDYLQGRLSPAEMHAMEKAALQDPLLADALEGFREVDPATAARDLAAIEAALAEERNRPGILVQKRTRTNWLRIAASVILIAGAAMIGWYLSNKGTGKSELAHQTDRLTDSAPLSSTITVTTPAVRDTNTATREQILQQKQERLQLANDKKLDLAAKANEERITAYDQRNAASPPAPTAMEDRQKTDSIRDLKAPAPATLTASANVSSVGALANLSLSGRVAGVQVDNRANHMSKEIAASKSLPSANAVNKFNFSGRIVDINSEPVAGAVLTVDNRAAVTDQNGYFNFNATDSIAQLQVNSVGYKAKNVVVSSAEPGKIVLDQELNGLNEVVVMGYGTKRKNKTSTVSDAIRDARLDNIKPANGWEAFYVDLNSKMPADKKIFQFANPIPATTPSKKIVLELSLDSLGKPMDATIISSEKRALNKPLINALKTGPAWRNTDGTIATGRKKILLYFAD